MKKNSGVTLIELIIAMSILTMIISAGSSIYLSAMNLSANAQYSAQTHRNAMIAIEHIRKHASEAATHFHFTVTNNGNKNLTFNVYDDSSGSVDFTKPPSINRSYVFGSNAINYTSSNGDVFNLNNISNCVFDVSSDGLVLYVTITAMDNSGNSANTCTLNTRIVASYASSVIPK